MSRRRCSMPPFLAAILVLGTASATEPEGPKPGPPLTAEGSKNGTANGEGKNNGAAPTGPAVVIDLGPRQGSATPTQQCFAHTGGGNIDVAQPTPDVVVVTMTGVAVAGAYPVKTSF